MVTENKTKRPIAVFIIGLIIIIVFVIIWLQFGSRGIFTVFKWFILACFIIGFIGLIFYAVYWIFFKTHKKDAIHLLRQKIISACKSTPQTIKQELWFLGDDVRFMSKIGKIMGICRIQSSETQKYEKNEELQKEIPKAFQESRIIYFIVINKGLISRIFGDYDIIGLFEEDIYNKQLSYPRIYVLDSMFSYSLYEILWCSKHFRETWNIDLSMKDNIYRMSLQEILKNLPNLLDNAIDLDGKYKKDVSLTQGQIMGIQPQPKNNG